MFSVCVVKCHRNPHPRGTVARRLWVGPGLCEGLDIKLHEVVILVFTTCEEVGVVKDLLQVKVPSHSSRSRSHHRVDCS